MFKMKCDFMRVTNIRLYHVERNQNMYEQYGRRESLEITGIPVHIGKDNPEELENEVIAIAKEAKVQVNRQPLKASDICAVHRLKDKKTTIVRVVNRKFAFQFLVNGKNLKDTKRYGPGKNVYINNSFCHEFKFLNFVIRKAKKDKLIHRYRIRGGVTSIQMEDNGDWSEIGHVLDLENKGIPIPDRK